MPGINDSLNWNLIKRDTLTARVFQDGTSYLSPLTIPIENYLIMLGFSNPEAKSNWWLAANVYQQLLTLPSSTSQFQASVEGFRARCRLNTLTLIRLPNYELSPFLLEITFPRWHKKMYVEVWGYSGGEYEESLKALSRIESQINNFSSQGNNNYEAIE